MNEYKTISFTNPDGTVKTKEQFAQEMANFYDAYAPLFNEKISKLFEVCTKTDTQIDPKAAINTFNFLDKSIVIDKEITDETARTVIEQIRFWNAVDSENNYEDCDPITIYIDCPGGSLTATFSIIAAIYLSNTPIYTINLGRAWSGGFFILIAGDKRYGVPYASYLFHEGSGGMIGDAHKALQEADFYKYQLTQLKEIVLNNTNISEKQYEKHQKDDWWFGNEEALKYKVIDDILTDFNSFLVNEEEGDEDE